jgi:adenylate kinase family enzyme
VPQGNIYFFADDKKKQKFLTNPDKYLLQPSNVKYLQVAVLGGPHSGKTAQAQLLAKQYDLVYLNPEEILTKLINGPKNDVDQNDTVYQSIIKQLKAGASVSGDLIVALLKREIESKADKVFSKYIVMFI